jgi:uncharacterized membrane protein
LAKIQAQNKLQIEQAQKQNVALQKQIEDLSKSQKTTFDKLTDQNKEANAKLEKERQRSMDLERRLAATPSHTSTYIIIAIVAVIIGYIIATFL